MLLKIIILFLSTPLFFNGFIKIHILFSLLI